MSTDQDEVTPQALADVIGLTGTVIPAEVIATWTRRERDAALEWAAAEHLSASDNPVRRVPQPEPVARAAEICASPALAQLAVEAWTSHREVLRYARAAGADGATEAMAQDAVTGLLALLGGERPGVTWQDKARALLAGRPGRLRAADLMMLLGHPGPCQEELDAWLASRGRRAAQ